MNCWRRPASDTNPSHWLMKVNKMFYAAERQRELVASGNVSAMLPQFKTLALHQCPSLAGMLSEKAPWPWGKHLFLAATAYWTQAGLWKSLSSTKVVELHCGESEWTCFEDIYYDRSYGSYFPGRRYQRRWQDELRKEMVPTPSSNVALLPQLTRTSGYSLSMLTSLRSARPAKAASILRASQRTQGLHRQRYVARFRKQDDARAMATDIKDRCARGSVRIVVFQRTEGSALRRFRNLADVMSMLSNHTSNPVEVVTVTSRTPVSDQALLFAKGFDMLVTPHGSHLSNFILSEPEETAIIEVVPTVFETSWAVNAGQAGFRSYITSTGHRALCDVCDRYAAEKCAFDAKTGLRKCADHAVKLTLLQNDMVVDTAILSDDVGRGLRALCNITL